MLECLRNSVETLEQGLLVAHGAIIAPIAVAGVLLHGDAAELGQQDGLTVVIVALAGDKTAAAGRIGQDRILGGVLGAELLRPRGVIVDGNKIGGRILPAVLAGDKAGGVKALDHAVERIGQLLRLGLILDEGHAPALVQRHPGDQAGMVVVAGNCLGHVAHHVALLAVAQPIGAGQLAPHQQTHLVSPVQVAGILKLLMLTRAVVAHLQGQFDVLTQCIIAGSGQQTVGPVALVEDQALEERGVVQQDVAAGNGDLAHAEVGIDNVLRLAVHDGFDLQIIQRGIPGPPHMDALQALVMAQVQHRLDEAIGGHVDGLGSHNVSLIGSGQADSAVLGQLIQGNLNLQGRSLNLGSEAEIDGIVFAHAFHPHALPDAGNGSIPALEGFGAEGLLAAGLIAIQTILAANDESVLAFALGDIGHVKGEGRITAFMAAQVLAVHPDVGLVIHGAEVQQTALAGHFGRNLKRAAVPDHVHMLLRVNAAQLALIAERNLDLQIKSAALLVPLFLAADIAAVKRKVPLSVQGAPCFTHTVRSGMFISSGLIH